MNLIPGIQKWICKLFGHSFSSFDLLVFEIKTNAINNGLGATIKCWVCGRVFTIDELAKGEHQRQRKRIL